MKKLLLLTAFLLLLAPTAFAQPIPASPALWPHKADWAGRPAVIFPAKLYATASYLLLYRQPGEELSGVEQLALGRRLAGRAFTVQGLYELKKPGADPRHYWLLAAPGEQVWVRDTKDTPLANLPFALDSEINAENKKIAELTALAGATVWIDANRVAAADLSAPLGHLSPLTVVAFKSTGPFSDVYTLTLQPTEGAPVVWAVKITGGQAAAYSNAQFAALLARSFFRQEPRTLFPHWAEHLWPLVAAREVRVGWDKEMALMSWGDPDKVEKAAKGPDKDLEIWQYAGNRHLYFKDKLLVKIKIPDPAAKPGTTKPAGTPKTPDDDGLMEVQSAVKKTQ